MPEEDYRNDDADQEADAIIDDPVMLDGITDFLLHDGRARGFAEAILWHGGEAEAAREAFRALSAADRDALVAFTGSR